MARRKHAPEFKAKVALAAIKGEETTSQIASRFKIHPAQVRSWKNEFLKNASVVFEKSRSEERRLIKEMDCLYKKIGQITVERDFLARKSGLL